MIKPMQGFDAFFVHVIVADFYSFAALDFEWIVMFGNHDAVLFHVLKNVFIKVFASVKFGGVFRLKT